MIHGIQGIGCLAGPVLAAAVVLDHEEVNWIDGLNDSKRLNSTKREALSEIMESTNYIHIGIGVVEVGEIDSTNILAASLRAMEKAVEQLRSTIQPDALLVDGRNKLKTSLIQSSIVGGDHQIASIAAASIVAKVARDKLMMELDKTWPQYGFAKNKGYPTARHLEALASHGECPIHRKSFKPVKQVIARRMQALELS